MAEETVQNNSFSSKDGKTKLFSSKVLIGAVVVIVLGLAGWGGNCVYQKLNSQDNKISDLNNKISDIGNAEAASNVSAQVMDLQQQILTMQDQLASGYSGDYEEYVPPSADITIEKVFSYNDPSFADFTAGESILIIDVVMTNKNDSEMWFSSYELKLKGQDNTIYPSLISSPLYESASSSRLPDGRLTLNDVSLMPDETVRGSLVFYLSKAEKNLTLSYQNKTLKEINL